MIGLCLHCQSREHVGRDCKKIKFMRASCCFKCGFPQKAYGEDIHGNVRTGECEIGLRDIISGGCWVIYREEKWLKNYFLNKKILWKNEEEYLDWLGRLEFGGEMVNGVRIILECWREKNGM